MTPDTSPTRPRLAVDTPTSDSLAAPPHVPPDLAGWLQSVLAPPAEPGDLGAFGDYRVLGVLGAGGMGVVLRAHERRLDRPVALKLIHPRAAGAEAADRFLREARAMAATPHPRIVPVYAADTAGGTPFIAMQLLAGESLSARLRRERVLPVADAVRLAREAAEGLAAAHAAGLTHRDVKPDNLFLEQLDGGWHVRLLDFGLARGGQSTALTVAGGVLGTPQYMAPEQAAGQAVDGRADLFSLGCVLYHLLAGRRPFDGPDVRAVLAAVLTTDPPAVRDANPEVSERLAAVVDGLLAKDPAARTPPAAAGLVEVLRAIEHGELMPPPPAVAPPVRRRRLVPALTAAAVLLAAGVVMAVALNGGQPVATPTTEPSPPAGPVRYAGSVDLVVRVDTPGGGESYVGLSDPRAMPLVPGQSFFKVRAVVEPAAYLYLFWIDESGTAVPLYPWAVGDWDSRPGREEPRAGVDVLAPNDTLFTVTGADDGMETIFMLARPRPLAESTARVRGWFAGLDPVPFREPTTRIWFQDFDLPPPDPTRELVFSGDVRQSDPMRLQQTLRRRVGTPSGLARAVTFARLGKPTPPPGQPEPPTAKPPMTGK